MAILSSKSTRFARSMNYTLPEYRRNAVRGTSNRLTVVAPMGPNRETTSRNKENGGR